MQIDDARRRLASLPHPLPAGPRELLPTLLGGAGWLPGGLSRGAAAREAAVLVLLYPDAHGEAILLLTARPSGDLRHAGEVSFPGGVIEPGDASPEAAALREAHEEVGLDPVAAGVEVVAVLDAVEIPVSGFRLTPVVAVAARVPAVSPDPREVAAILHVPLDAFRPGGPIEIVEAERSGRRLRYGAYPVGEYRIWGATARVLGQLGAVLA